VRLSEENKTKKMRRVRLGTSATVNLFNEGVALPVLKESVLSLSLGFHA
jgi:hypothetical protein